MMLNLVMIDIQYKYGDQTSQITGHLTKVFTKKKMETQISCQTYRALLKKHSHEN